VLGNYYISAHLDALTHILNDPDSSTPAKQAVLECHLNRTIRHRSYLPTSYRFLTRHTENDARLRRIRAKRRAGKPADLARRAGNRGDIALHGERTVIG